MMWWNNACYHCPNFIRKRYDLVDDYESMLTNYNHCAIHGDDPIHAIINCEHIRRYNEEILTNTFPVNNKE